MKSKEFQLTPEQEKIAMNAIRDAWQAIAYDILSALSEEGESSISQEDAIEVTLDADHVLTYGRIKDPVVKDFFSGCKGDYEYMKKLARKVITCRQCM